MREKKKKRGQTRLALTKYIISFTKAARVRPYQGRCLSDPMLKNKSPLAYYKLLIK